MAEGWAQLGAPTASRLRVEEDATERGSWKTKNNDQAYFESSVLVCCSSFCYPQNVQRNPFPTSNAKSKAAVLLRQHDFRLFARTNLPYSHDRLPFFARQRVRIRCGRDVADGWMPLGTGNVRHLHTLNDNALWVAQVGGPKVKESLAFYETVLK